MLRALETQEWFKIVTPFLIGTKAVIKGTQCFYIGLNKRSFLFEALTVSDLQWSLEAQAFKICLPKLLAVRKNCNRRMLRALETQEWFKIVTPFLIGTKAVIKGTQCFYKGLNKKSFVFEAPTVSDLQWSLEAQAFKICLPKLLAVRKNCNRRMLRALETQEWFKIVTPFLIGTKAVIKGTQCFYKGLNKKSFVFEAPTVSDLQWSLEAQAFKICLPKLLAVRKNYKRRMLRAPGNPGVVYNCHPFYNWHPWGW